MQVQRLMKWGTMPWYPFNREAILGTAPDRPGVYGIGLQSLHSPQFVYIGSSKDLRQELQTRTRTTPKVYETPLVFLLRSVPPSAFWFCYEECKDYRRRETKLIRRLPSLVNAYDKGVDHACQEAWTAVMAWMGLYAREQNVALRKDMPFAAFLAMSASVYGRSEAKIDARWQSEFEGRALLPSG